ncbi:MAG: DUF1616 domain-containing protein [Solirubrobacterales bacterium]|nr:DUF1616 domain-containing protein [Solirubrobacterales bacterium]
MRGNRDLALISASAVACALLAIVVPWEGLRLVAALPLAFVLPGYAIVAAAFGPRRLDLTQSIMLSLGCSLAVLCLGALVLNYVPGGIQTASWAILLAIVAAAASGVAALHRPEEGEAEEAPPVPRRHHLRRVDILCGVVVVVLAAGAVGLANTPLPAGGASGYTTLWILPAGSADRAVRLGVSSSEQGVKNYILTLRVGGGPKRTLSRFALSPGDEHVFTVPTPISPDESTLVSGMLFRESNPVTAIRKVRTWLPPVGH